MIIRWPKLVQNTRPPKPPPKPLHRLPLTPLTPPLAPVTTRKCKNAPKWKTAQNWKKGPKMAKNEKPQKMKSIRSHPYNVQWPKNLKLYGCQSRFLHLRLLFSILQSTLLCNPSEVSRQKLHARGTLSSKQEFLVLVTFSQKCDKTLAIHNSKFFFNTGW